MTERMALSRAAEAIAAARAAPLSRKRAMLALLLVDAAVDELFAARGEGDVLAFREALAARSDALALVLAAAAMADTGPRLRLEAVAVPPDDYPGLGVADFMVSLYNRHTVPRVLIVTPAGARHDVHAVLAEALAALALVPG
jgi:hypothetical protein